MPLKKSILHKSRSRQVAILGVILFASIGALLLGLSNANTSNISIEAESSATSANILIEQDDTASGRQYVSFGEKDGEHQHSSDESTPIPYISPSDPDYPYNPSVIPEDDTVVFLVFGINRSKGQQLFTVDCKHSHYLYDDPILYPGQAGASHYHEFFGDATLNANSTLMSIISNPQNTCEIGADRSAYWTPAAYQDGELVRADNNKFYYKVGSLNDASIKKIQPMPLGLRMIAGDANSHSAQDKNVTFYYSSPWPDNGCNRDKPLECKTTEPKSFETNANTKSLRTIPNGDTGLRALIRFPQCWDGEHLWLPGTAHMSYAVNGSCPDTHPNPLLQVQFNLGWSEATGGEGFTLDSGPWYTLHGDFINGWKPETYERLTDFCVRGQRYCGLGRSETAPCNSRASVRNNTHGCVEFKAGESGFQYFGNPDYR